MVISRLEATTLTGEIMFCPDPPSSSGALQPQIWRCPSDLASPSPDLMLINPYPSWMSIRGALQPQTRLQTHHSDHRFGVVYWWTASNPTSSICGSPQICCVWSNLFWGSLLVWVIIGTGRRKMESGRENGEGVVSGERGREKI